MNWNIFEKMRRVKKGKSYTHLQTPPLKNYLSVNNFFFFLPKSLKRNNFFYISKKSEAREPATEAETLRVKNKLQEFRRINFQVVQRIVELEQKLSPFLKNPPAK